MIIHSPNSWAPHSTSFLGMVLGWLAMNTLLLGGLVISAIFTGDDAGGVMIFGFYFGICSAIVCFLAWLLIAWPVTLACERSSSAGERWWVHGVRGVVGAAVVGALPLIWLGGEGKEAVGFSAIFAGLAVVVGGVAGSVVGWHAHRARLTSELNLERTLA